MRVLDGAWRSAQPDVPTGHQLERTWRWTLSELCSALDLPAAYGSGNSLCSRHPASLDHSAPLRLGRSGCLSLPGLTVYSWFLGVHLKVLTCSCLPGWGAIRARTARPCCGIAYSPMGVILDPRAQTLSDLGSPASILPIRPDLSQ